jgi:hypothetical protein
MARLLGFPVRRVFLDGHRRVRTRPAGVHRLRQQHLERDPRGRHDPSRANPENHSWRSAGSLTK